MAHTCRPKGGRVTCDLFVLIIENEQLTAGARVSRVTPIYNR